MKGSQNSLCVRVTISDLGDVGFWVTDKARMRGMAGVLGVSLRRKRVTSANWSTGGPRILVPTINSMRSDSWGAGQGPHQLLVWAVAA